MTPQIILGTMNMNYPYSSIQEYSPEKQMEEYTKMVETYLYFIGDKAIIDTAYYYGDTKTEYTLGKIFQELSQIPKISTKVNPWFSNDFTNGRLGQLSKESFEKQFSTSLTNLQQNTVEYLFLHCPDYETPFVETLETAR